MENVIDRGEVVLYTREDLGRLENYLTALSKGDENYKPEGLTVRPRTQPEPTGGTGDDVLTESKPSIDNVPQVVPEQAPKIEPNQDKIKDPLGLIIKESNFDRKS